MLSMNVIRDFRGVCDLFMEYIPLRLVRLVRLKDFAIVLVLHIHYEHIIVAFAFIGIWVIS